MRRFSKVKPIDVVKAVYDLSVPVGMGYMHFQPGPLPDDIAQQCIRNSSINMDYVLGRQCKFYAKCGEDYVEVDDKAWYAHSDSSLKLLISNLEALEKAAMQTA